MENPLPDELPTADPPADALLETSNQAPDHVLAPTSETEAEQATQAESVPTPHGIDSQPEDAPFVTAKSTIPPDATGLGQQSAETIDSHQVLPESGTLEDYAQRAENGRLNPAEETEATRLLRESLLGGRAEVVRAVSVAPRLPWVVTVQATTSAWPEIKPTFRAQFLAGLARNPGEAAARIRLSLARGLFKVDAAAAQKLILLTLKVLRNKGTGLLEGKGASILSSVLIGRGKAWILQIPLAEMKPVEADLLVFAAIHGAFHQPQAPLTQLSIIKWAAAADRLSNLPPLLEQMTLKGVSRWSAKWQASLRREVTSLPDSWVEVLKAPPKSNQPPNGTPSPEATAGQNSPSEDKIDDPEFSGEAEDSRLPEDAPSGTDRDEDEDGSDESEVGGTNPSSALQKPQGQRPVYVSKTVPSQSAPLSAPQQSRRGAPQSFNLQETLRQVEHYVSSLRNELQAAQKQLRQRDDERRQRRNERPAPVANPGELSIEEAIRLNHQLESRNAELQSRIDELTLDSEARAASRGLVTDTPIQDPEKELRTLLGFKLKEDFDDFQALEQEARDLVVQQHYRTVLRHVFEVLEGEGVRFENSLAP